MGEGEPKRAEDNRTLPADVAGLLQELAQSLLALENAASFYPVGHQARERPLHRLRRSLLALIEHRDPLLLGFSEHEILWDGAFFGGLSPLVRKLVATFFGQGIARVTFRRGITDDEIQGFVSRLATGRGGAARQLWATGDGFPHIAVEGIDYESLMADDGVAGGDETSRRRDLWKAMILRCMIDPQATISPEELQLLREQSEDPAALGTMILDALGPAGWTGAPETIAPIRRLTEALDRAAAGGEGPTAKELHDRLQAVGRTFPDPLRFRLVEAALGDETPGLFAKTFGSTTTEDLVGLLAKNFQMETEQIARLTRVFQHLVPRQLDRMELFPQLKDQVEQGVAAKEALPESAWGEVQELLTGELGEFMSPSYRELMQRISAREDRRREAEDSFTALPTLFPDLEARRVQDESLRIQLELLRIATGAERLRATLERVVALCRAAFAAGDRAQGFLALRGLVSLRDEAGEKTPAADIAALEAGLRSVAEPGLTEALAADIGKLAPEDRQALLALFPLAPDAAALGLILALQSEEDPDRRRQLVDLLAKLGQPAVAAIEVRLGTEPPGVLRGLLTLLGELKTEAAVPAITAALGHADPKVRREALRALITIDTPEARRPLPGLLGDEDEELMQMAATHLGAIGHQASRKELLRALGRSNVGGLRAVDVRRAAVALGRMRAPEAVVPLSRLLRQKIWVNRRAQEELCTAAAQALRRIGTDSARKALELAAGGAAGPQAAVYRRLLAQWGKP
jgi:HEAT repeat protein